MMVQQESVIRVLRLQGPQPGPRLLILGAIHGDETCGAQALERLAREFEEGRRTLSKGQLTLVPVCNERAYRERKRYIEENLNRIFQLHETPASYEQGLANQLVPLVHECDYLLDLHSMQAAGEPFVFLNRETRESENLCRSLGTRWILKGWPEVYRAYPDKLSSCTQTYADRLGIPNALIECGTNGAPEADEVAYQATLRCLARLGMIEGIESSVSEKTAFLRLTHIYFREALSDGFTKTWNNFESVREGEIVGFRGANGAAVRFPCDGLIVFPSPVSAIGTEWFYVAVEEEEQ